MPMIDRCRRALLAAAAAYLVLLPTGALSFWRSLAFAAAVASGAWLLAIRARDASLRLPLPDRAIPLAVLAWSLWSAASLAWSIDPRYSLDELKPDVIYGVATMALFYLAVVGAPRGFAVLAATWLAGFAVWTSLAAGMELSWAGWDARPLHRGEGAFATYLVTASPFLWLLAWRVPVGVRASGRDWFGAALLFALLIVTARLSENRIVWIAFAAQAIVLAMWSQRPARLPRAALLAVVVAVAAFGLLFADAARDRAHKIRPDDGSVSVVFATDPRLAIWSVAFTHIADRPWLGHGYGLHILGRELGRDTGDTLIMHPHNLFVSQWLQTGVVGVALLAAMLVAVARRLLAYARSGDVELARYGAIGLAVLAGYVVRNLTDDFFIRANGKLLFAALAMVLAAGTVRAQALARVRASAAAAPATAAAP